MEMIHGSSQKSAKKLYINEVRKKIVWKILGPVHEGGKCEIRYNDESCIIFYDPQVFIIINL